MNWVQFMVEEEGKKEREEKRRRAASGVFSSYPAASLICHFAVGRKLRCFAVSRGICGQMAARTSDSCRAKPTAPWVFLVRCVDCTDRGHSFGLEPLGMSVNSSECLSQIPFSMLHNSRYFYTSVMNKLNCLGK